MIELQWIVSGEQRTLQFRVLRGHYRGGPVWTDWKDVPEIIEAEYRDAKSS